MKKKPSSIAIGFSLAVRDYPGYRFLKYWRDGKGIETVVAAILVQIAAWLIGCDGVKVTPIEDDKMVLTEEYENF